MVMRPRPDFSSARRSARRALERAEGSRDICFISLRRCIRKGEGGEFELEAKYLGEGRG